jgi:drug/metabolite transporter (DMT)-like permease
VTAVLLCILFTVCLSLNFKVWPRLGIRVLPGILHNYLACVLTGLLIFRWEAWSGLVQVMPWTIHGISLGALFIGGFTVFAHAVQYWGIGLISAVQKMSLAGSALFAWWFFREHLSWAAGMGIILAMGAIPLLVVRKRKPIIDELQRPASTSLLILATFVISVLIESGLMWVERTVSDTQADPAFLVLLFLSAFGWGFLLLLATPADRRAFFTWRHLLAGWVLGVPNFFSIYFLMKAFGGQVPLTITVPTVNVGTILLTIMAGYLIFGERFSMRQKSGLVLGVCALLLLTLPL